MVGCAQRRRLVFAAQFLFGQMIELVVPCRWLSGLLPKRICAPDDLYLNWAFHCLAFLKHPPGAGTGRVSGWSFQRQKLRKANQLQDFPFRVWH